MKTLVILINGIHLPYAVIDQAIEMALKESYQIHALFLRAKKESKKGYSYPSDLETAHPHIYDEQAVLDDERILEDNMQIVKGMVESEKIPYNSSLRINATIKVIQNDTAAADLIIIDKDFDKPSLLSDPNVSLKELSNKLTPPVQILSNN